LRIFLDNKGFHVFGQVAFYGFIHPIQNFIKVVFLYATTVRKTQSGKKLPLFWQNRSSLAAHCRIKMTIPPYWPASTLDPSSVLSAGVP